MSENSWRQHLRLTGSMWPRSVCRKNERLPGSRARGEFGEEEAELDQNEGPGLFTPRPKLIPENPAGCVAGKGIEMVKSGC